MMSEQTTKELITELLEDNKKLERTVEVQANRVKCLEDSKENLHKNWKAELAEAIRAGESRIRTDYLRNEVEPLQQQVRDLKARTKIDIGKYRVVQDSDGDIVVDIRGSNRDDISTMGVIDFEKVLDLVCTVITKQWGYEG